VPQHNLVVANFRFRISTHRVKQVKIARTKWWELKGERSKVFRERVFVEGAWSEEDANIMWVKMATCIRKVASEVFRVTKVSSGESKDTWWWTEDVQKAIKEKKECYRSLFHDRSAFNIERYKVAKKTTKRAVSEAKGRAYDDLYQRLSTKKREKDVYKIARIQERSRMGPRVSSVPGPRVSSPPARDPSSHARDPSTSHGAAPPPHQRSGDPPAYAGHHPHHIRRRRGFPPSFVLCPFLPFPGFVHLRHPRTVQVPAVERECVEIPCRRSSSSVLGRPAPVPRRVASPARATCSSTVCLVSEGALPT
jgi:hypothetical protein